MRSAIRFQMLECWGPPKIIRCFLPRPEPRFSVWGLLWWSWQPTPTTFRTDSTLTIPTPSSPTCSSATCTIFRASSPMPPCSAPSRERQVYRPVVSTSLAIDYWLGRRAQAVLFPPLHLRLVPGATGADVPPLPPHHGSGRSRTPPTPGPRSLAAACYGLHPANAETVNYIIQRADLYSTLGVVASLLWFVALPGPA